MSYDIYLIDPVTHETIEFDNPHHMRGGTYQVGGSSEAWLNITYNYADYYYEATENDPRFFGSLPDDRPDENPRNLGIRGIYGKTGAETIKMLSDMIHRIESKYKKDGDWITTDVYEGVNKDYWEPTAGNAVRPLYQLMSFCQLRPDGVWRGD